MKQAILIGLSALLIGGCIHPRIENGHGPIVSPTIINTDVQDVGDPSLPPYTPWWVGY